MSPKNIQQDTLYLVAIVNSCGDAIIGQDLSGNVAVWNHAAEQLFGYTTNEVHGRKLDGLALFETPAEVDLNSPKSTRKPVSFQSIVRQREAANVPVSVVISPVIDDGGQVIGVSTSVRCLDRAAEGTDRKQRNVERHAENSEGKKADEPFRILVEAAPNAMIMVASDGRIALVNSQTEKLFGYDRRELLGQRIEILVPERFRNGHGVLRTGFFKHPSARAMGSGRDLFGIRKDGREVPIEIGLNPVSTQEGEYVLTSIIDITERKRSQDDVAAAKLEVEARNKDLETMLHVTSHDLREPLRAIRNFSLMLSERYGPQMDEKGRDLLNRVRGGADRLDRLVQDILNVARTRRISPPLVLLPARLIVADALRILNSRILETHAQIHVADDLPSLRVSLAWGSVALQNLIANALKFTRENTAPEIEIRGYEDNSGLESGLIIRDHGIGVPLRHAERIFELFQRAVGREVDGTGAGLAIVKQIAERHGGRAWVQPHESDGSDFFITFGHGAQSEAAKSNVH